MRMSGPFKAVLAAACLLATVPLPAVAQLADLANDTSPDRMQKLIDGAKKEGTVSVYSSITTEDMAALIPPFEKKYGVKVRFWRASNEDILQRAVVENRGNRFEADVYETDGSGMEGLKRENLLQPIKSPVFADLVPQATKPEAWIGTRLNIIAGAYNTNSVRAGSLPKSYEDLTDPKWKGKLGIEAADSDWLATIVASRGEEQGLKLMRDIVKANGASVRKGHTLMANLVASGEVPLALTTYLYKTKQLKDSGAPIEPLFLDPVVARVNGIGVAAKAPHPHAAILFFDYMLSDGQEILAKRQFFATNKKYDKDLETMKLTFVDSAEMLDQSAKWDKLFNEIVIRQSK
jgi:iron(III) transport system substrate-binding protein